MKKLIEMDEFEVHDDLTPNEKSRIKEWVKKYEKYFNFHDDDNFMDSIDSVVDDCINSLKIGKGKGIAIKKYLEDLYDLSDGISMIMAPNMEVNLNDIDQVQRFQY
jgi:hypothetical protein